MSRKGFVLPSILILLTLLLLIYSQIMVAIPSVVSSLSSTVHGIRAEQSSKNELFGPVLGVQQGIRCATNSVTRGHIILDQKLCSQFDQIRKLITISPGNKLLCNDAQSSLGRITLNNLPLSPQSIIASSLCFAIPLGSSLQNIITGNLELHNQANLNSDLFVLGYINAGATLTFDRSIRIFTGGDVKISGLNTPSSSPIDVYLHSRTGEITLGQSHPLIRVHCLAKAHNCSPNYPASFWAPGQITTKRALYFQ